MRRVSVKKLSVTNAVTEQLRSYATRGVFREFEAKQVGKRAEYRFVWLTSRPVRARFDATNGLFTLIDLLPSIKARSEMDIALRAFIAGRFSTKLPVHRRLSRTLIRKLVCVNRRRAVSLRLTFNQRKLDESTRQAVLLVSEIFQNFLAGPYHDYMVRHFDLRED